MKLNVQITLTVLIAALAGGGWFWLVANQEAEGSRDGKSRRGGATQVLVEKVAFADDRIVVRAVGTGTALNSAVLHPSVSGEVVEVLFKAEQRVKKGDLLVRLGDDHQRLAVRLANVALKKARRDAARISRLAKSGHASRNSLDTAQTGLETAAVRRAQAKAVLADRAIVAPFSGIIGLTDISPGDRVTDGTSIATLDERSAILVDFNLTEDHAVRIRVGDRIAVRPSKLAAVLIVTQGTPYSWRLKKPQFKSRACCSKRPTSTTTPAARNAAIPAPATFGLGSSEAATTR